MPNRKQVKQERKSFAFELKSIDDAGHFEGYLATFDERDSYGDIIKPGAFKKTIRENKTTGWPLLWQHYRDEPIGIISEATEDSKGLLIKGELCLEVQKAKEARALMQLKAVTGLSIGYIPVKWKHEKDDAGVTSRILNEIALKEGSAVTFPAMDNARMTGVKGEGAIDIGEVETGLQDAGMDQDQIKKTLDFIKSEITPQEPEPGDHSETPAGTKTGEPDAEEKATIHSIEEVTRQLRA